MGRDKALLVVDGRPLAVTVAAVLDEAGATDVVAVGGDAAGLSAAGLKTAPDGHPGEGPLGGILTALDHFAPSALPVVVMACDLSAANPDNVIAAVDAVAGADPAVGVPLVDGRRQWMHACWTPGARPLLAAEFARGERAAWRAVEAAVAGGLSILEVTGLWPGGFRDVDQPGDLGTSGR